MNKSKKLKSAIYGRWKSLQELSVIPLLFFIQFTLNGDHGLAVASHVVRVQEQGQEQ